MTEKELNDVRFNWTETELMNKQGGLMNADLIKALRCKEYFDLCNVESCRYHLTNTKSGSKCAIKLMATDAAAALDALRAQPENEPIVHCAECEHYTPSPMGGNGCLIRFNGRTEIIPRNPTDYCSYGKCKPKRSEGNEIC